MKTLPVEFRLDSDASWIEEAIPRPFVGQIVITDFSYDSQPPFNQYVLKVTAVSKGKVTDFGNARNGYIAKTEYLGVFIAQAEVHRLARAEAEFFHRHELPKLIQQARMQRNRLVKLKRTRVLPLAKKQS
jgi:hypothetical protein